MKVFWNQPLGLEECPYAYRWGIAFNKFSIRVHKWISQDDPRYLHDHAWWFLTFVIKGGYDDASPDGVDIVRSPTVRYRRALHRHTVKPHPGGAWTILLTGATVREWGFWVPKHNGKLKFLKHVRYFYQYGHHPCD